MYVVTVTFEIAPDQGLAFRQAILRNAAASLKDEPDCHRFDVCFSEDGRRCFLYELYTDEAAFEHHTRTAHFAEFNRASEGMVTDKKLETYVLADDAREAG